MGVPSPRNYHCGIVLMKHVYVLDRLRVLANIYDLVALKIPLLDVVVSASKQYADLVNAPGSSKYGYTLRGPLQHHLTLYLIAHSCLSLIYNHVSIPKTCEKDGCAELLISRTQRCEL